MMVVEGTQNGGSLELMKFGKFLIRLRRIAAVRHIQTGQRSNPVDSVGVARRQVVRRLEIGPRLDLLPDVLRIVSRIQPVGDDVARCTDDTNLAVVKGKAT